MRIWHLALAAILTISCGIAYAQTSGTSAAAMPTIVTMDTTKWTPGTGMMKGAEVAVLTGDPTKAGYYAIRLRLPPNTTFAPHYHGDTENVTVISGTVYLGLGDKVDASSAKGYGPGTFATIPANAHHYAFTKDEAAIVQVDGIGPASMTAAGKM
jgi:quercetin dioxygenase-like cupin family protein